ncbi:glycosyltransferase [Pseudoflavonifractor phocaeensis]|uniref:glycosyltransferase n=1 Tax=Pseudoflavonifractor phocaeensis TaxID=1870988 RepID=UPI00195C7EC4|nr:glycosyltransferase [Pseudoflavonifractor phocaeensis]MBM6721505.1 glycosyltransferase [Pseudoflavonifractor phocaeensis]
MRDINDTIRVSILLVTYNQHKYIRQAITSVISQNVNFRYELLIGDDCSTDLTKEIIDFFAKKYPDVIIPVYHAVNLGASENFFSLLTKARGEYIALLEGDDFWTSSDKLRIQAEFLDMHQTASGCVHRTELVDKYGMPLPQQKLAWVRYRGKYCLRNYNGEQLPGHISGLMFRRCACPIGENSWILRAHRQISDRCIFLTLLSWGSIFCLPGTMSAYRVLREDSTANLTHELYTANRHLYDEMQLYREMEVWVMQQLKRRVFFSLAKADVLTAALGGKQKLRCCSYQAFISLLRLSGTPIRVFLQVPLSIMKKLFWKLSNTIR